MVIAKATTAAIIDCDYVSMEADLQTKRAEIAEAGIFANILGCFQLIV
jgi:hypothetical protein